MGGKKIMAKVETKKARLYPGDTTTQVRVIDNGRVRLMFNVWRHSVRGIPFYKTDTFTGTFKNMAEVKQLALNKYEEGKRKRG